MRTKTPNKHLPSNDWRRRALAVLVIICLLLSQLNLSAMAVYAADSGPIDISVSNSITARLDDGVLTLTGMGDTDDYTAESAPFLDYAGEIHSLVIEEGITYIGAYLFYGLGALGGDLTLPGSIVGFGDYAFSGSSADSAPHFSVIQNQFEYGEVSRLEQPVQKNGSRSDSAAAGQEQIEAESLQTDGAEAAQPQPETPSISEPAEGDSAEQVTEESSGTADTSAEALPSGSDNTESTITPESEAAETLPQNSENTVSGAMPEPVSSQIEAGTASLAFAAAHEEQLSTEADPDSQPPAGDPDNSFVEGETQSDNEADSQETIPTVPSYSIETITQQEISQPDSLFYPGQTGAAICAASNASFCQALTAAGYQLADGIAQVTLDDVVTLNQPVLNGQITLPECPAEITSPYEDDAFFTHQFAGWTTTPENDSVIQSAGDAQAAQPGQTLAYYAVWTTQSIYKLRIETNMTSDAAVYTLQDAKTGQALSMPDGYSFTYQWQIAPQAAEGEIIWSDIPGADQRVYQRPLDPQDSQQQLRCAVTAVKQTRLRMTAKAITLYSDPVNAAVEKTTVYVDQIKGKEQNDGSENSPVQTLAQAAELLKTSADGGTVESNEIVIVGPYTLSTPPASADTGEGENCLFKQNPVPVTIRGIAADEREPAALVGQVVTGGDYPLYLYSALCFQDIRFQSINHIYCRGNNLTMGGGVTMTDSVYLYGSGRDKLIDDKIGAIAVYSGNYVRIAGHIRSNPEIKPNAPAHITVGGSASVNTIIAGNASGKIDNANVSIDIRGGHVQTLVGGNQGFNDGDASFTGQTAIRISGGQVDNLYGAGTGRNISIPTFAGQMKINVTGGQVGNIYGAGSAAYVVSPADADPSAVEISVTGGQVGNIFAAGRGGESAVTATYGNDSKPVQNTDKFGSLTGKANITIGGTAEITGNIYASGAGYTTSSEGTNKQYDTTKNAYLDGTADITITGSAIVKGNIYGGGKGIAQEGYEECARVTKDSDVRVKMTGGSVKGNIYGGGQTAKMEGNTSVSIAGGTVQGKVYGGGERGQVMGNTTVDFSGGTIEKDLYGGAYGQTGERLVLGGSTVNMTGGWVKGNLYGGSELSNDGPETAAPEDDLIFVNLVGGVVSGRVFGGGFSGIANGSTHLHIGKGALGECKYYQSHAKEKPDLSPSAALTIAGSVYAGGDYGGEGAVDYNKITVTGTSHIYIDGTEYDTGEGSTGSTLMRIDGGVFGSGASCDAGSTRLVTLKNYGQPIKTDGAMTGTTRTLAAIQRADRVLLLNAHVTLTGQSDVANTNQTTLYSLNAIGNYTGSEKVEGGNGLVLQAGSTLILKSAAIELAQFRSLNNKPEAEEVTLDNLKKSPNTLMFDTGTVFRVSYTPLTRTETGVTSASETYGPVRGYTYLLAGERADAYAYAAQQKEGEAGGFADQNGKAVAFVDVADTNYRYWQVRSVEATAERTTVLTAQTLENRTGYSVASGTIELPPTGSGASYEITSVTISEGLTLVDAAKNGSTDEWVTSAINDSGTDTGFPEAAQTAQAAIKANPLSTFGLFMKISSGFQEPGDASKASGKVVSNTTAIPNEQHSIIGQSTAGVTDGQMPTIHFYLTYYNEGITASRSAGTVNIELTRHDGAKTIMNVEIVTKTSQLTNQTIDLYATHSGSYTGRLIIPAGASRSLSLSGVDKNGSELVAVGTKLDGQKFTLTMQPVNSNGWSSSGLLTAPYDLGGYTTADAVSLGTTDSRYEAPVEFVLKNAPGFTAKQAPDQVILTLQDTSSGTAGSNVSTITLNIHWKASVVSHEAVAAGRQYNETLHSNETVTINQKSAVTAAFTLSDQQTTAGSLWLELRDSTKALSALPQGTQLTLMMGAKYYSYTLAKAEEKILLSAFQEMWSSSTLSGNLSAGTVLTVIADFSSAQNVTVGSYSLHLRNDTGADSDGAPFTIDNTSAAASLSLAEGSDGLAKGKHCFKLTVSRGSDTRLLAGSAVVFSLAGNAQFPEGVVFKAGERSYYPNGGKVYVPLGVSTITMDTTQTAGLSVGSLGLQAAVFPTGGSAGAIMDGLTTSPVPFVVQANPVYTLKVEAQPEQSRVITSGQAAQLTFTVTSSVSEAAAGETVHVTIQRKNDSGYGEFHGQDWSVTKGAASDTSPQTFTVAVPTSAEPGTYRLLFTLGDQKVAYNIIISKAAAAV